MIEMNTFIAGNALKCGGSVILEFSKTFIKLFYEQLF